MLLHMREYGSTQKKVYSRQDAKYAQASPTEMNLLLMEANSFR